ncbi:DNA polymerase III subunit chi [Methylophilus sp. 5]|uniref:DNA polymerase III subunit chi n=1 Tax=Methylophilus sp. 5 TaxID=1112274 RepID=UPI00048A7502|nr:DNA polymerase III subunit chi [Methylophilus sp. 5]
MTKIRFYTDVTDPSAMVQQLVSQALARQRSVTIFVSDRDQAQAMGDTLWQQAVESFVPNALADAANAALTPVQLAWLPEQIRQDDLLFNCQASLPKFFSRFRHVFELIGTEEADKVAGRQRWAFYRDRGYEIQHMNKQTQ